MHCSVIHLDHANSLCTNQGCKIPLKLHSNISKVVHHSLNGMTFEMHWQHWQKNGSILGLLVIVNYVGEISFLCHIHEHDLKHLNVDFFEYIQIIKILVVLQQGHLAKHKVIIFQTHVRKAHSYGLSL